MAIVEVNINYELSTWRRQFLWDHALIPMDRKPPT